MLTIIIVSVLISIIFALLGCLVLWKNYVYFSDGLAHTSMLIGIIGTILEVPLFYAASINSMLFALIIFKLNNNSSSNTTIISFTTSIIISLSLLLTYLYPNEINIHQYLVGDIISASIDDIKTLILILIAVLVFFFSSYKSLILMVLSKDIASSKGVNVKLLELTFLIVLSFTISSTIKMVGALLINGIILIPAMIARLLVKSPIKMIVFTVFSSLIMNLIGVLLSFYYDLPFALSIILPGGVIYLILRLYQVL